MHTKLSTIIAALALSASFAHAEKPQVCRGDMHSAEGAQDPYYKDATWIGNCFFKSNTEPAKLILEECHYRRPCVVTATVRDGGEIIQVHSVKLDGRDMICRGTLINTDKESGDTAKIGLCRFTIDQFTGMGIIGTCRYGRPCTVRARVVGSNITHVYSVRAGR
jgi:hypothetical protein